MTLQASGAISMSQINAEFGRGTSLSAYRGTTWYTDAGATGIFASTNLKFSDFYSKRATPLNVGIAYQTNLVNPANQSSYTFTNVPFGPASSDRYIVVMYGCSGSSSFVNTTYVPTVTIGGVSATIHTITSTPGPTGTQTDNIGAAIAAVPSGTSGTVVISGNYTAFSMTAGVWALTNIFSATPVGTAAAYLYDQVGSWNATVATQAGGVVLAHQYGDGNLGYSRNWTTLTENYDYIRTPVGEANSHSGASGISSSGGNFTVTVNPVSAAYGSMGFGALGVISLR